MTVSFYGKTPDGSSIMLDFEHPAYLQLNNGNAHAVLSLLAVHGSDQPDGEMTIPEARRAILYARATFERRASKFTRASSDTKRSGHARVISGGIGEDYLARRVDDFERFVNAVSELGAASIYWA